jgi:anhydro-N-acetylmuramic acid kinase
VQAVVDAILAHPFLARPGPKSTGREEFGAAFYEPLFRRFRRVADADLARSILAATARALKSAIDRDGAIGPKWREMLLSGGGAKHPVLVEEVRACFAGRRVKVARTGVFAPERHEPAAMALFAARTRAGLPSSLPQVTGARGAAILGHVDWPLASKLSRW